MLCVFPEKKKNATPVLCLRFNLSVLQLPSLLFPSRQGVAAAALELVCIFMTLTSMRTAAPGSRAARLAAGQQHPPLADPGILRQPPPPFASRKGLVSPLHTTT